MRNPLSWQVERNGNQVRFRFSGEITENSNFAPLLRDGADEIVLDLAGIERINSCGVREWLNFVGLLAKGGHTLVMERCSVPIVHQLNMVSNFRGGAEVRSVYAPYLCGKCDQEGSKLIELDKGGTVALKPELCPSCGANMEFDDLPEAYFAFRN